jgi:hypothetical protein
MDKMTEFCAVLFIQLRYILAQTEGHKALYEANNQLFR